MLLKRLKTLAFLASIWVGPALATGTTPLSLVQQFDSSGQPLAGCLLYFFQAGTVATPQTAYADYGMTTPLPNPVQCDASGRVPQHWLADGLIHIRLTDASGVVQIDTTMQVLGPSSGGGGGGGTVDPTTIMATGDIKVRYGTGPISGFVRSNGLTIGNATSGATERANADTQNLFIYLYQTDPNLVVSGGRTGNALNDYNAGKTIALPDARGRDLAALADMGNTTSGVLSPTYAGCGVTNLGSLCGNQSFTLATANLPPYTPSGSVSSSSSFTAPALRYNVSGGTGVGTLLWGSGGDGIDVGVNPSVGSSFSGSQQGGTSTPFAVVAPSILMTVYIKL